MKIRKILLGLVVFIQCGSFHAFAQEKYDDTTLRFLYERSLQDPDDEYVLKRIADERATIRSITEDELVASLVPPVAEDAVDTGDITKAIDKQRQLVTTLSERLQERKVDLDILHTEEKKYYSPGTATGGSATDTFRLTKTYPELLAKKAALEERVAAIESLLSLQQTKLKSLTRSQRLDQFALLIDIGVYVLIIAIVILIERLIRNLLLRRIKDIDRRYTATKMITWGVYLLLILWLLGTILAQHPGALASVAIVGAGIAIALQDVVKDIFGWFVIVQNRLFTKGNRITVADITGEVIDVGLFRTILLEIGIATTANASVLERTGKTLYIPNSKVLTENITNHNTTSDYVKAEIKFCITFESDWRRAKEIAEQVLDDETGEFALREMKQSHRTLMFYIPHRTTGNQVYTEIADDGVLFTLRFTVPVGEKRPVVTKITDKLLEHFRNEPTVELAYRTSRILAEIAKQ